jgi:hypothetical protein
MLTRFGRHVKKPEVYVPVEIVEDDYAEDEYDNDSDLESMTTTMRMKKGISKISSSRMTMTKMRNIRLKKMNTLFRYGSRHW